MTFVAHLAHRSDNVGNHRGLTETPVTPLDLPSPPEPPDTVTATFTYDGDGDRVAQTINEVETQLALDRVGLPEVIATSNGDRYLHLSGLVVQQQAGRGVEYLLADGLGSVRQVVDGDGLVVAVNEYDPYGVPLQGGGSPYGYTGEWWQGEVSLLYLRARWYDAGTGRFVSRDMWQGNVMLPGTLNRWNYVVSNPTNQTDPAGTGPIPLILHLLTLPAGEAVAMAKSFYSKAGPLRVCFLEPEHGHSPKEMTVDDLLTDYVCERGQSHLYFEGDARLTQQLARTAVIQRYREEFYLAGGEKKSGTAYFEVDEIFSATIDTLRERDLTRFVVPAPLNITHFLGTFDYEIRRSGPNTARFQIDNTTNLESGTRIPPILGGVHPSQEASAVSVEELLEANPFLSPVPLWIIVGTNPVISVLKPKLRAETGGLLDWEGGGEMKQTFTWQEQYLQFACEPSPLPVVLSLLKIGPVPPD